MRVDSKPGSIISVFGANLAETQSASGSEVHPDSRLLINGLPALLLYASPSQINAQIPSETPVGTATVSVMRGSVASARVVLKIQPAAPGIFEVLDQDGTVNGPHHRTSPGSILQAFVTGLSPANSTLLVSADIGGQIATVLSVGVAPGLPGVFQVNLRVPDNLLGVYPLVIQSGGVTSNTVDVSIGY